MTVIEDPAKLPGRRGTVYPSRYAEGFEGRLKRPLTELLGLCQFGVNLTTLEPGAKSSQRHWHAKEDEFIYVVSGQITLVTDKGEQVLGPGTVAGFAAGVPDGHQLINRTRDPATYLEIGTRSATDDVVYPDIDMLGFKRDGTYTFTHKNGERCP